MLAETRDPRLKEDVRRVLDATHSEGEDVPHSIPISQISRGGWCTCIISTTSKTWSCSTFGRNWQKVSMSTICRTCFPGRMPLHRSSIGPVSRLRPRSLHGGIPLSLRQRTRLLRTFCRRYAGDPCSPNDHHHRRGSTALFPVQ